MNLSPKISRLMKKKEQIEARLKLEAAKEKARQKRQDTRRKILLGAYLMERMEKDKGLKKETMASLEKFLFRKIDRELFGLTAVKKARAEEKDGGGEKNRFESA
jgi:large subunit ribosomal protein L7/L12